MLCWRFPVLYNIGSHLPFYHWNLGIMHDMQYRMKFAALRDFDKIAYFLSISIAEWQHWRCTCSAAARERSSRWSGESTGESDVNGHQYRPSRSVCRHDEPTSQYLYTPKTFKRMSLKQFVQKFLVQWSNDSNFFHSDTQYSYSMTKHSLFSIQLSRSRNILSPSDVTLLDHLQ